MLNILFMSTFEFEHSKTGSLTIFYSVPYIACMLTGLDENGQTTVPDSSVYQNV